MKSTLLCIFSDLLANLLNFCDLIFHHGIVIIILMLVLVTFSIFTIFTLTIDPTLKPRLIAFTIFFQTVRFLAMTPFGMMFFINFRFESLRISIHKCEHRIIPFLLKLCKIMASNTITPITNLIESKAITIKFKTFSFFTITCNFL